MRGRIAILLLIQGFLGFCLAILADKVSAIIPRQVSTLFDEPNIWFITAGLIGASAVTGALLHQSFGIVRHAPPVPGAGTPVQRHVLWLLPFSFFLAGALALVSVWVMPPQSVFQFIHAYELTCWGAGIVALVIFCKAESNRALGPILLFSVGFALGAATVILLLRPNENVFEVTVLGWLTSMILTGGAIRLPPVQRILWPQDGNPGARIGI